MRHFMHTGVFLSGSKRLAGTQQAVVIFTVSAPLLWMFSLAIFQASSNTFPYAQQACFCFGLGGTLLACATIARTKGILRNRLADITTALALPLAAITLTLPDMEPVALCTAMFCGGASLAWLVLRCFALCCRFDFKSACTLTLVAFVLSSLLRLLLTLLPCGQPLVTSLLLAIISPAAIIALQCIDRAFDQRRIESMPSSLYRAPCPVPCPEELKPFLPFVLELACCAFILGLFMGVVESSGSTAENAVNYVLRAFTALLLLALLDARASRQSYRPAQTALFVALFCLLVISLLGGAKFSDVISHAVFSLSRNFALAIIYLMALYIIHTMSIGSFVALGALRGLYEIVQGIGIVVNANFGIAESPLFARPNAVLLVSGVILLLVANRLIIFVTHAGSTFDGIREASLIKQRCELLGAEYQLTAREVEVAIMLCSGVNKKQISETLVVSVNTIRWHCQNIYEKVGVHSQQELIEEVESIKV